MKILLYVFLLSMTTMANAGVVINEFMASNVRAFPDITDFEDYPDWIELKNDGATPVNLAGYYLSDDPLSPFKWAIPTTATIEANGFLLVMADGHNAGPGRTFPRGYWPWRYFLTEKYHAPFKLKATGETITLTKTEGLVSIPLVLAAATNTTSPSSGAVWRFLDDGSDQGSHWTTRSFDDSAWSLGPSDLGYGDSPATTVSFGPDSNSKFVTTYFRHHFSLANTARINDLTLRIQVDDGCIVYLNGVEIARNNLPQGRVDYRTRASSSVGGTGETRFSTYQLLASDLVTGDNVLAAEVHQASESSSDLRFNLELVASSHSTSRTVDSLSYSQQVADLSFGRDIENPIQWQYFAEPTPGSDNTTAVVHDIRIPGHSVTASTPGGIYDSHQTITLSSPDGDIRYTLDGSNPTSASQMYSEPINLSETTTLRARCFAIGQAPGPIATHTYFIGENQPSVPYISLVADPDTLFGDAIGIYLNQNEPATRPSVSGDVYKNKDAPGNIEFFEPDGSAALSVACGIRIGGENNWVHAQKALNVAIRSKYGDDGITYDLFPGSQIPVHSALSLREGGDDWENGMIRDAISPRLAEGHLSVDTAAYRPCIVFINGDYYGIHNLRQRWDETWFAQQYHVPPGELDHLRYGHLVSSSTTLGAESGTTDRWLTLLDYLNTHDLNDPIHWNHVESEIDLESLMDYVILESYGNNTSWHHDREFWRGKTSGSKWKWFATDLDRTFNISTLAGTLSNMLFRDEALVRLKTSTSFITRLAQRYAAHMAGTFKPSRVHSIVSAMDEEVRPLIPRHSARWAPQGITETIRNQNIQEIKDYASQRALNFHGELSVVLGIDTAVNLTLVVNNPGEGSFLVQGVPVSASTFKIFPHLPFTLEAIPSAGYAFGGWLGATGPEKITLSISGNQTIAALFIPSNETVIGGQLSKDTNLTLTDSPYVVSTDLIVPSDIALTIQPGVIINMTAKKHLRIQGILNIAGTAAQPVTIKGKNGVSWGGISFETPNEPSSLSHLILRHATKGHDPSLYSSALSGQGATVTFDFLDIKECENPIYVANGDCTLRDSTLHIPHTGDAVHVKGGRGLVQRCTILGNAEADTDGIDFDGVRNGRIEDCRIYRFQGENSDGIDIGEGSSNLLLQGNLFYYCSDKGISIGQGSTVTLRKNLIVGCQLGVGIKDFGSSALIDQNTFVSCQTGVSVYEKNFGSGGGKAIISNSIFSKSISSPVAVDRYSELSVSYSLSDTNPLNGFNNWHSDPLFIDPAILNFQLQTGSPAIDRGDPNHDLDIDGTRADIGANYVYSTSDYPFTIGETIVVNEILANSGPHSDWIEIHNRTLSPVDISGWFLSDSASDLKKYRLPSPTIVPASGFLVVEEETTFGSASMDPNKITPFALSESGETVYLTSATDDRLGDYQSKESFGPSIEGTTIGFFYKPSTDTFNFVPQETPTPGAENSNPQVGPVVISEIMYHPQGNGDAEYLELLNVSNTPVTLYDIARGRPWRISDGVEFDFPVSPPLVMAPGERVVITGNVTAFHSMYGLSLTHGIHLFEWRTGSLSNAGESLQLSQPGPLDTLSTVKYVRVDRVNYDDNAPWPRSPDGRGHSLVKAFDNQYGNDPSNWIAAAPSPGRTNLATGSDSDMDGLPDDYELAYGLNPNDSRDALVFNSGDGYSNLAHYMDDFPNPSVDDRTHLSIVLTEHSAILHFRPLPGKSYTLEYKTKANDSEWFQLDQIPAKTSHALITIEDRHIDIERQRFYRIIAPIEP